MPPARQPPANPVPLGDDPLRSSGRRLLAGLVAGFVVVFIVLASYRWLVQGRLQPAGQAELRAARRLWEQQGIAHYLIEVEVKGPQAVTYRVRVRGGRVAGAWRNDKPLSDPRTMDTWSVPGMFRTMELDLENIRQAARGPVDPQVAGLEVRARFDRQTGVPLGYLRLQRGGRSAGPGVSWRVTRWAPDPKT